MLIEVPLWFVLALISGHAFYREMRVTGYVIGAFAAIAFWGYVLEKGL